MHAKRLLVSGAVVGCGVLGLTACGDDTDSTDQTRSAPGATTSALTGGNTPVTSAVSAKSTPVANALAALDTAANAVPGGKPFDLETELQGTEGVFDAKVAAGGDQIDVLVDATGHTVRSQQQAPRPSDDIAKLDGVTITAADALRAAGSRDPSAEFDEMEIDTDDSGTVVWKVDLMRGDRSEVTYSVDAHNGQIIGTGR
ncbi:hypothetical protein NONO_c35460 [Nocardia nova SH22a]|uniref:PepSY domain-containing protein n=1 Tax=Nocardia nova SH22a TaxID=1415166 RepID=W5TH67_9NOCA|nr:PepSY domain-containing protein [Nocardia nova]AHH18333.1 hypothetical protein NONO_c35460 [Nocardia nova SH22a]